MYVSKLLLLFFNTCMVHVRTRYSQRGAYLQGVGGGTHSPTRNFLISLHINLSLLHNVPSVDFSTCWNDF